MDRFANIEYLPYGEVILFLNQRICKCRADADHAPDEVLEMFYLTAQKSFEDFRNDLIDMFYGKELEA
jgi:hypothetical protein